MYVLLNTVSILLTKIWKEDRRNTKKQLRMQYLFNRLLEVTGGEKWTENSVLKNGKGLDKHSLQGIIINLMLVHSVPCTHFLMNTRSCCPSLLLRNIKN